MSGQVWVRPFDPLRDKKLFVDWLYAGRDKNRFDPELFKRSQVRIFTLYDKDGVVGFIPVTLAFLVESLAFRPGLLPVTEARALRAFQQMLVLRAAEHNIPDAFFVTQDETLLEFAGRHGWEKPDVPLLNLHFAKLEPKDEDNDQSAPRP